MTSSIGNPWVYIPVVIVSVVILFIMYAKNRTAYHEALENKRFGEDITKLKARVAAAGEVVALITGANSGIGFSLAQTLASTGIHVILGCRNANRAREAQKKVLAANPGGKVSILILDVANPASVIAAVKTLKAGGKIDNVEIPRVEHLDYLFLNAGVMPSNGNRWLVATLGALNFRYFMETGRSSPRSHHFVANPTDDSAICGAPSVFATHVLGHLLLAEECADLLRPSKKAAPRSDTWDALNGGRIIWTGSRAACAPFLNWEHLQPPQDLDEPSGHDLLLKTGFKHGESYGEAKYAVDLVNPALEKALGIPCNVICPGAVETELTPGIMSVAIGMLEAFRCFFPGFNVTAVRGAHVLTAAAAAPSPSLRSDCKYVSWAGEVAPTEVGFWAIPEADQRKMFELCGRWLSIWRRHAAAGSK